MPIITLPDGSQRQFENPITVADVATSIGPGLAKAAIAGKINDRLVDTSTMIEDDVQLAIITDRDPDGLEIIRHSCAHLMAQAVKSLFPTAQVTIGPVVEHGFYYDFAYEKSFSPEDLEKIQAKMEELVAQNFTVTRSVMSRHEAIQFFRGLAKNIRLKLLNRSRQNKTFPYINKASLLIYAEGLISQIPIN
ncbi:threonyl-tRNA synthetase [Beggiatoa sp. PS]|nr:threonyl-tRNA synthetase [Beggiatoa sp. PS]